MNAIQYIGLDVHKKTISYCIKTADGQIVQEGTLEAERTVLRHWAKGLRQPWHGAMEATLFSAWIYDTLKPYAQQLYMGHPAKMKAITAGKKKSDRIDARTIADLVRCDLLPCLVGRSYVRYVVHLSLARARQVNSLGTIVSVIVGHDLGGSRAYITGCKRCGDGAAGPRQESRRGGGAVVGLSEIACIRPHDLDVGDRKRTAAVVGENRGLRCAGSALALCTEIETTWRHAHCCNGRDNTGSSAFAGRTE
jgi:hypothetical protein